MPAKLLTEDGVPLSSAPLEPLPAQSTVLTLHLVTTQENLIPRIYKLWDLALYPCLMSECE